MRIGMWEIVLLIALAIVLFGAKRLPEVGRAAGDAIREFKLALNTTPGEEKNRERDGNGGEDA